MNILTEPIYLSKEEVECKKKKVFDLIDKYQALALSHSCIEGTTSGLLLKKQMISIRCRIIDLQTQVASGIDFRIINDDNYEN
jgi:hypothetical protein